MLRRRQEIRCILKANRIHIWIITEVHCFCLAASSPQTTASWHVARYLLACNVWCDQPLESLQSSLLTFSVRPEYLPEYSRWGCNNMKISRHDKMPEASLQRDDHCDVWKKNKIKNVKKVQNKTLRKLQSAFILQQLNCDRYDMCKKKNVLHSARVGILFTFSHVPTQEN